VNRLKAYYISIALLLGYTVIVAAADSGKEIAAFFRTLDSLCSKHDSIGLVRLAASVSGKDLWNMAAGEGPNDADSLRIRALRARPDWLFDERGMLRSEILSSISTEVNANEEQLLNWLTVNPADTPALLELLRDRNPSVRWIGVYKTRFISSPPPPIIQALRLIARDDDHIILVNVPGLGTDASPAPLHETNAEFSAPLRQLANEQLDKWRQKVPRNRRDEADVGLKRLVRVYTEKPVHRLEIEWAVSRFGRGGDPVAKQALTDLAPETPSQQDAVAAVKRAGNSQ